MSTLVKFRWTDPEVDPNTVFAAEGLTVETRSRTLSRWDVTITENLTADQEASCLVALENANAVEITFTPTVIPKQKRVRRIIDSGSTAIAASSSVSLATFTRRTDETVWFTVFSSNKTVAYNIENTGGAIPTDETLKLGLRKATTTDQMKLVAANGLEAITVDWVIVGVQP